MARRSVPNVLVRPEDLNQSPRPGAPAKLAHVVFKTPRSAEMARWYATVLDAMVVYRDRRLTFLTYDEEHHRIALVALPKAFRIPGRVWALHRKVWGFDHVAFTYDSLPDLVATYRRLADAGITPVWCINHGPTTSMYYEDPDGNRVELQVDNFSGPAELVDWIQNGEFASNPIGVEFDPDVLERLLGEGVPAEQLLERGSAPPDGRAPRAGLRTIRWKTL
ncbi:VOC family protein [Actinomadura barringtoniae]|uniref:VOC family protein n=1 Tax=Actinomadura barringtoniae TaxID=1427535 RepID=A0A939T2Z5_9ACTN|nr:VOC family protein [Actinomadura barringtoniae]MBO2445959.1 VOC family protein [Actinomadura barringtoniae]